MANVKRETADVRRHNYYFSHLTFHVSRLNFDFIDKIADG